MEKQQTMRYAINAFRLVSLVVIIFGMTQFFIGLHSADTGQNMRVFEQQFDITMIDIATNFKQYDSETVYIIGLRQIISGYFITIAGAVMFGSVFWYG